MSKNLQNGYQSPGIEVIRLHEGGVLCVSTEWGATTDNFKIGDTIDGENYF